VAKDLVNFFRVQEAIADRIVGFELVRELGRPPVLEIEVRFSIDLNPLDAVGSVAYLAFGRAGEPIHEFAGVVEEVTQSGSPLTGSITELLGSSSAHSVRLRVVSRLALLERHVDTWIFQDLDVKEIVTKALESAGIPSDKQRWQLSGSYDKRPYCVQYFESTLDFVSRLLEEEGIYFHTIVEEGDEMFVFSDDSPASDDIDGDPALPYRGDLGIEAPGDAVITIRERAEIRSGKFVLRDHDFERPRLDLTAEAEAGSFTELERYDYPGLYTDPRAARRSRRCASSPSRLAANSSIWSSTPAPARGPPLRAHRDSLRRHGRQALRDACRAPLRVGRRALAAPRGLRREGLRRPIRRARARDPGRREVPHRADDAEADHRGPQSARVVGPAGAQPETIHTDEHGRIKVKFHWDLGPDQDDKATFWIRTSQLQTSGSMVIPRIDWEVLIEFLEGNPDRPVVMGKLYNGLFMPPYALPQGRTRTSLQTASSPGGGGTNEIRFEDQAGGEEIMIHAQYDQTKATANDKTTTIGNNTTRVVGVNETIQVAGNQTTKITMGSQLTVSSDQTISVGGNRNVEVNAVTGVTAGGSISITVGGNHFEMDGNPLEAILQIAAEKAIEVAQAAAGAAMAQINAAVQAKVDQVMGPINEMTAQIEQIGAGMEALRQGDLGAVAGIAAQAAGLPMPPGFGGAGGGEAGGGGEWHAAGDGGGEGGGGGDDASYTARSGSTRRSTRRSNEASTLARVRSVRRSGSTAKAEAARRRPTSPDPRATSPAYRAKTARKGQGHSTHKVAADYTETTGRLAHPGGDHRRAHRDRRQPERDHRPRQGASSLGRHRRHRRWQQVDQGARADHLLQGRRQRVRGWREHHDGGWRRLREGRRRPQHRSGRPGDLHRRLPQDGSGDGDHAQVRRERGRDRRRRRHDHLADGGDPRGQDPAPEGRGRGLSAPAVAPPRS
jgi:type VI secretion system secreted protein VgrG